MKKDDIFEALTDIDDKFIAAAHQYDLGDGPVVVYPAPKRPVWKTLVPVAACLAVLCTAGAFGARYIKGMITEAPENTSDDRVFSQSGENNNSLSMAEAPALEEVRVYPTGAKNEFTMEEFPDSTFTLTYRGISLKGRNADADDVPLISADYMDNLFLCDMNGDGKRELCATVQNGGVQSVEILEFASGDRYISDRKNKLSYLYTENETLVMCEEIPNVDDRMLVSDGSRAFDRLTRVFSNSSKAVRIDGAADGQVFELAEFPDLYFEIRDDVILKGYNYSETMISSVVSGAELYLADLNGDGKREICALSGMNTSADSYDLRKFITVYDVENDETYFNYFDNVKVESVNGVIVLANDNANSSVLTLDLLMKLQKPDYEAVPLTFDHVFTLPDFEGFTFTVDASTKHPTFCFGWENNSKSVGNTPDRAYLCDLDGDGRREIIVYNYYDDLSCLRIYGFMDNGEVGSVIYYEKDHQLAESDGKLIYETAGGETKPIGFSKSDLIPNFAQSYTEILSWDHTMDLTEIFPWSGKYGFSIDNRRFQVTSGGETVFDSGVELEELYRIHDEENDRIYFAFKVMYNGAVGLLELTENSANSFYLNNGASLKPTNDVLFVVTDHGSKTFALPEQFNDILG